MNSIESLVGRLVAICLYKSVLVLVAYLGRSWIWLWSHCRQYNGMSTGVSQSVVIMKA